MNQSASISFALWSFILKRAYIFDLIKQNWKSDRFLIFLLTMIPEVLQKSKRKIADICRRYQISELALFGSRARGDFTEMSDFDFLVEFQPDAQINYFDFFDIQEKLEELVKKKVDLVSKNGLKPLIRNRVLSEAKVIYAA